ncbi:putative RNA methyltransferase [Moraxella pluranimalium]|uniref:Methyltransferase n=1 Tax=Moraxella pluranimalium TaxID=470453 RepID=A0A1T0CIH2_9GAMM|nr:methyltransferase domain-containing protein [Moraxella pluranimalium]OOS22069.1 methyltransferase [Moraxella pluranimalium]
MLTCPICQQSLTLTQKSYRCPSNHSFDIAKEGYVNLHVVQHKKSKNPGDTPESVAARRAFLSAGYYQPLKDAIKQTLSSLPAKAVLDIGCGEGYYTDGLADVAEQVIAIDIAKSAVQIAAKADKAQRITWVVGTGAVLPVADGMVDVCTSLFSPLPKDEMRRVLTADGHLIVATPAPHHLYAMRQALFGQVIAHEPEKFIASLASEFVLIDERIIHADMTLDNTNLKHLIAMTPYAYKAKADKRAELERLDVLDVRGEFCVYVFKKSQ